MRKKLTKKQKTQGLIVSIIVLMTIISILLVNLFYFRVATLEDFSSRGVWLSYQDLYQMNQSSKKAFKKDVENVLDTMKKHELNTLYLQVRPFNDAIYDSKIYPKSYCVKKCNFDVLQVFIDTFKDSNIKIIGWVNPYRISLNKVTYDQFKDENIKYEWLEDDRIIEYDEYKAILNPANHESQNYILEGIKEVISNYEISGIVFDDYFYVPGTHKNTTKQSRFDAVNALVKQTYRLCHSYHKTFGISSQANYDNCQKEGADVDTWLSQEGYIDYLMPQIYWSNEYKQDEQIVEMFKERSTQFSKIKRNKNVKLYASLAIYKCGKEDEYDLGWFKTDDNLSNQLQLLFRKYSGYAFYSYRHLTNENAKKELDTFYQVHQIQK